MTDYQAFMLLGAVWAILGELKWAANQHFAGITATFISVGFVVAAIASLW